MGFLWGMLGALVVDLLLVLLAAFTLPRLLPRVMQKAMRAQFGKRPAGSDLTSRVGAYTGTPPQPPSRYAPGGTAK